MTREEAKDYIREWCPYDRQEEIIKALSNSCEDCIGRQAVLDILKDKWNMFSDANDAMQESIDTIEALPPVTPEPKTGHWINIDATHSKCDKCGAIFEIASSNGEINYCPNCGSRNEVKE